MKVLASTHVKPGFNPIHARPKRAGDVRDLRANGPNISGKIFCLLFLKVLLEEYDAFQQTIG